MSLYPKHKRNEMSLLPDPEHDLVGNGQWSACELAQQLEMRGYEIWPDRDDSEHSYVTHPMTGDLVLADLVGRYSATVANRYNRVCDFPEGDQ